MPSDRPPLLDLARAIDRGEIVVLFQPQVSLVTGAVIGAEALARWRRDDGTVGAEPLIAAAEAAGCGVALSEHVQALALAAATRWPAPIQRLGVSLNVTAEELARPDAAARLLARIGESGVASERVTVELVERAPLTDVDAAAVQLGLLREAGCRVALDDFGSGNANLHWLQRLPVDAVKLDRALVERLPGSGRDALVVERLLGLLHDLGVAVLAEGVETEAQRDWLRAAGCDAYQGFLCAGAVRPEALARLAAEQLALA